MFLWWAINHLKALTRPYSFNYVFDNFLSEKRIFNYNILNLNCLKYYVCLIKAFFRIMLMPKKNLVAIYEHLFREGVMVAKKDTHAPKHPELESVPNLQVIKALTSLKSRGYVKEQFAWRHYYWYLTNEGIGYLRNYLHLPPGKTIIVLVEYCSDLILTVKVI